MAAKKVIPIIPRITSGSHSRLTIFEQCKHRANLKYALKIPEPDRPLPPGKSEHANDRGTRLHDNAELFVKGKGKLAPELFTFRPEFEELHRRYKADKTKVLAEDEWGMDANWEPCEWNAKEVFLRLKLDYIIFLSSHEAVVVDLKTGRREGNEVKHAEQTQLYQLVAFLRYPKLMTITTELWYPDVDELHPMTYRRDQGLRFMRKWNERLTKMTTYQFTGEKEDANPSIFTCRYCMYGKKGSQVCKRGV